MPAREQAPCVLIRLLIAKALVPLACPPPELLHPRAPRPGFRFPFPRARVDWSSQSQRDEYFPPQHLPNTRQVDKQSNTHPICKQGKLTDLENQEKHQITTIAKHIQMHQRTGVHHLVLIPTKARAHRPPQKCCIVFDSMQKCMGRLAKLPFQVSALAQHAV